jgi:uncharacterized protein (DUF1778 family)
MPRRMNEVKRPIPARIERLKARRSIRLAVHESRAFAEALLAPRELAPHMRAAARRCIDSQER